jgi:hypothetical protein
MARIASLIFRVTLTSPPTMRCFTSCCVIVEAPLTTSWFRRSSRTARTMLKMSTPGLVQKDLSSAETVASMTSWGTSTRGTTSRRSTSNWYRRVVPSRS